MHTQRCCHALGRASSLCAHQSTTLRSSTRIHAIREDPRQSLGPQGYHLNFRPARSRAQSRQATTTTTALRSASTASAAATSRPLSRATPATAARSGTSPSSTSSPSTRQSPSSATSQHASPPPLADLSQGLRDSFTPVTYQHPPGTSPLPTTENADPEATFLEPQASSGAPIDWTRSFHGLSSTPFSKEASDVLLEEINPADIEVKPDGILYLPEIKYRRILNRAFGPGGWGLAPRGETLVTPKMVTREFGLVVGGRLVSVARGEQQYFDPDGIPTATEGCKSNALMRCCKDLGVASELWDPVYLRSFKKEWVRDVWVEHVTTKKKRRITVKKGVTIGYPYKEATAGA